MSSNSRYWAALHGVVAAALIVSALYFIFVEHAEHTLRYLPIMIILLCPLMHIFMHKSHHNHKHMHNPKTQSDVEEAYRRGFEAGRKQNDPGR